MENNNKETELSEFFLTGLEPDLHHVVCKDVVLTKNGYEELFNAIMLLSGNKKVRMLCDLRSVKMITREGGQYARTAFADCLSAAGMVAQTPVARMVITFFLVVMKPEFPVKVFSDFESAEAWLKQLKNEGE